MFASFAVAALALSAASSVSALVVPRSSVPNGWATDYLEDYTTYHTRYLALSCQTQHSTTFFDECCHPLLATESISTARKSHCIPSAAASSSASAVEPTSTVTTPIDSEDGDCDSSDDDDEDLPYCDEDGDDVSSTVVASSTKVASVTKVAASSTKVAAATTTVSKAQVAAVTKAASTTSTQKTTAAPKTTSTSTTAAATTTKASTSSSSTFTGGFATFFYQGGVAGACGTVHSDSDMIAAIDGDRYGNLGAKSSLCGSKVKVTNPSNGKSVTVTIADACPTCENSNSIDLSVAAFKSIATEAEGMVGITWSFV